MSNLITFTRDDGLQIEVDVCWSDWSLGFWWDNESEDHPFAWSRGVYLGPFELSVRKCQLPVKQEDLYMYHDVLMESPFAQPIFDLAILEDGTVIPFTERGYQIKNGMEEG